MQATYCLSELLRFRFQHLSSKHGWSVAIGLVISNFYVMYDNHHHAIIYMASLRGDSYTGAVQLHYSYFAKNLCNLLLQFGSMTYIRTNGDQFQNSALESPRW